MLVVGALALGTASMWLPLLGYFLSIPGSTQITVADAITVHGGTPGRTAYGIALFHQGLAPQLWHTSYSGSQQRITARVLSGGVPAAAFRWLGSTSTWTDAEQFAREARAQKITSILVVTDWWHSRRALCADVAQLRGSAVRISFAPAPAAVGPDRWWRDPETRGRVLREYLGLAYYAVRYGMMPWGC